MGEAEPTPERDRYTREDYLNMAWEVLYSGRIYDEYFSSLAGDLADLLTERQRQDAKFHDLSLEPLVRMRDEVIERAKQQAVDLAEELNYGIKTYGAVSVQVEGQGGPIEMLVDRFIPGEQLGDIHPIVADQVLRVGDYSVSWEPDGEAGQ